MNKTQAEALHQELTRLLTDWPGANQAALSRVAQIHFEFEQAYQRSVYLREKMTGVKSLLGYWFSDRKWRQYGEDPARLRALVNNELAKLGMAIGAETW